MDSKIDLEVLQGSHGYTSTIYLLPDDPSKVCKAFNEDCIDKHFPVEKEVYERFSANDPPSSLLKYYGVHPTIPAGLVLELASEGEMMKYIWNRHHLPGQAPIDDELLYRWADQAAEALEFAHSLGVFNSDIHCVNFFLDKDLDLKVGDWAGASIDGSRSYSSYRLRHRLFDTDGNDVPRRGTTAQTEIFALGTALYYMVAGHDLWPELREPRDREEIKRRIVEKEFPDAGGLRVLGGVIRDCWLTRFASMKEVRRAVQAESSVRQDAKI
jgi:serine/threonine protein kinase